MTHVDLFAGSGGWEVAARQLGLGPVVGVELAPDTCAIRDAAGLATVQGDVMLLDPAAFAPVQGVAGSPPCPSWSPGRGAPALRNLPRVLAALDALAEGQDTRHALADADPGDVLVLEPLRWALQLRPAWVALEQVPAALPVWERTARALREHGYKAWTGVLNAKDYGVPQDRRRAVLIARLDREPQQPQPAGATAVPCHVLPWAATDQVGFPRRADRGAAVHLNGAAYRQRDLRAACAPCFTLTSKARSWKRLDANGNAHPVQLDELATLQGFPAGYPFMAAGSRSAAIENLANTVPPPLAKAVLEQACA